MRVESASNISIPKSSPAGKSVPSCEKSDEDPEGRRIASILRLGENEEPIASVELRASRKKNPRQREVTSLYRPRNPRKRTSNSSKAAKATAQRPAESESAGPEGGGNRACPGRLLSVVNLRKY